MELLDTAPIQRAPLINITKEINKYIRKWPWVIFSMLMCYTAARIYLRYSVPQFLTKTTLKLQESKNKNTTLSDLKNLGMGVSGDEELQGETTVIVSKPILTQVAKKLGLDVSFFSEGKIKQVELYEDSPLSGYIVTLKDPQKFSSAEYFVEPRGQSSYMLVAADAKSGPYRLGQPAKLSFGTVVISAKPGFNLSAPIKVIFKNIKTVVSGLESAITVTLPENKGLLMELSMLGPTPFKSEAILNEVSNQYNADGIKDKNLEAQNTQDFINDRLSIITSDLLGIENEKENFKRANQLTDLETQAKMSLQNANDNTKQILAYSTQLELVNSVISASAGENLLPTNVGLPTSVDAAISKYNDQLLLRSRVLKQATNANPAIIEMNKEIASLKNLIRKNLIESRETLMLQIGQLNGQLNADKSKISRYPSQEKMFRSIERQQNLKEQLYLYLLQKREENAITLAVTAPKAKVVNPAYTLGQVKPNPGQVTAGSLAIGFLLPLLLLFFRYFIDNKVRSREDLENIGTEIPVVAEIPFTAGDRPLIEQNDFSIFAESFRMLTSNLKFILRSKNIHRGGVILVTSTVKGEGKTTVSANTAVTLAGGSKVLLVGADIRNPQLHKYMRGSVRAGLTDFLVSEDVTPEKFISKSGISENLDVLFSGSKAPNPNDLLDMKKFDDMVSYLKNIYDYIILDSAPVMLVSDSLHLIDLADVVVYTIKSGFTEREMVNFAINFRKDNAIKNMVFALNNVKPEYSRYGYKYGYGYYSTHTEKGRKWWRKD